MDVSSSLSLKEPLSRSEVLSGIFAGLVPSLTVLASISQARAESLGVVDDLLADCPAVSAQCSQVRRAVITMNVEYLSW